MQTIKNHNYSTTKPKAGQFYKTVDSTKIFALMETKPNNYHLWKPVTIVNGKFEQDGRDFWLDGEGFYEINIQEEIDKTLDYKAMYLWQAKQNLVLWVALIFISL